MKVKIVYLDSSIKKSIIYSLIFFVILIKAIKIGAQAVNHNYPKTSAQINWTPTGTKAHLIELSKFDIIQVDSRLTSDDIQYIRDLNPKIIILPFFSTHYTMNEGRTEFYIDEFLAVAQERKDKGFDGMYIDLWNILMNISEGLANEAADSLRAKWPDGIHIYNAAHEYENGFTFNGFMWEDWPSYPLNFPT